MPAKKLTADDYRARKIKAAIAEKGLTQEKLAERLGVDQSVISRRINHVENMKVCDLKQLCRVLNLRATEILEVEA